MVGQVVLLLSMVVLLWMIAMLMQAEVSQQISLRLAMAAEMVPLELFFIEQILGL